VFNEIPALVGANAIHRLGDTMERSQGVTLVTLTPTRFQRFKQYLLLRWVLRYPSFTAAARRFKGRTQRGAGPGTILEALNFIHFGRWILIQKRPVRGWLLPGLPRFDWQPAERSDHGFMVFTSNFDDDWRDYVDTFMEATTDDLGVFWDKTPGWTTPTKAGFEGFFSFVDDHKIEHSHYYAAFPKLATANIKAALAVDRHVRSFAIENPPTGDCDETSPGGSEWDHAFVLLVSTLQHSLGRISYSLPSYPATVGSVAGGQGHVAITSLAPIPVDGAQALHARIGKTMDEGSSPFAAVAGTHFARLAVISEVHDDTSNDLRRPLESGYVLLSADADRSGDGEDSWLIDLFDVWSTISPTDTDETLIDLVWGSCYGFGVGRSRQQFVDYITETSFEPTVPFADYPQTSLWDIHRSLYTHWWFTELAFAFPAGGDAARKQFCKHFATSLPVDPP
jgi:hypothetical protein